MSIPHAPTLRALLVAFAVLLSAAPADGQPARFGFGYNTSAEITLVPAGSPAARGGLRVGDRITSVNGHDARNALRAAFPAYLAALAETGTPTTFGVWRGEAGETVTVTPAPFETMTVEVRRQNAGSAGVRHVEPRGDSLTAYPFTVRGDGALIVDVPRYTPRIMSILGRDRRPAPTLTGPDGAVVEPMVWVRSVGGNAASYRDEDSVVGLRWRVDAPAAGTWTLRTATEGAIQTGARLPPPLDCAEMAWAWDITEPGAMPDAFVGERTSTSILGSTPFLGPRLFGARGARLTGDGLAFDGARLARPPVGWGHVETTAADWRRRADDSEDLTIAQEVARCLTPYLAASADGTVKLFETLLGIQVRHIGPSFGSWLGGVEVGGGYDAPGETSFTIRHNDTTPAGYAPACLSGDCQRGTGSAILSGNTAYTGAFRDGEAHGQGVGLFDTIGIRVSGTWAEGVPTGEIRVEAPNGARWVGTLDEEAGENMGWYRTSCGASSEAPLDLQWDGFLEPRCSRARPTPAAVVADVDRVLAASPEFEALRGEALDGMTSTERWRSTFAPAGAASPFTYCSDLMGESCSHVTPYRLPTDEDALALAFTAADAFAAAHPDWVTDHLSMGFGLAGLTGRAQAGPYVECTTPRRRVTFTVDDDDATLRVIVAVGDAMSSLGFGVNVACPE